jgi:ABC-type transport system involved in multi-copper enzyme maturation permease subunit
MDWSEIKTIIAAFYQDLFRQPLAIIGVSAFMFTFGLIMVDADLSSQLQKAADPKLRLALTGDDAPLRSVFDRQSYSLSEMPAAKMIEAIGRGQVDASVEAGRGLSAALTATSPDAFDVPEVVLRYDFGRLDSEDVLRRTRGPIDALRNQIMLKRLDQIAISERWSIVKKPLLLAVGSAGRGNGPTEAKKLSEYAQSLATWVVLTVALGGTIFGGSLLVDEQEKGTLALLLISPTSNASIVIGFFLFGMSATLVLLSPSAVVLIAYSAQNQHVVFPLVPNVVPNWFLLLVPLVVLANALSIMLSTWAPRRRQLSIVAGVVAGSALLLTALAFSPSVEANPLLAFVPFGGNALAMQQQLLGTQNSAFALLSSIASLAYSAVALAITIYRMNSARIIELTVAD